MFANPSVDFQIDRQVVDRRLKISEERDLHHGAFLDGALIGWNLDVAVGLRQARDVARSLERREAPPSREAHGVELMTPGRRDDARPSGARTVRGAYGGSRAVARRNGTSRMYAFDRHEVGLPGMPKNGVPPTIANAVGLPGLTAMPWKIISPRAATRSTIRSRSPTELPPEKTIDVGAGAGVERGRERVERVVGRRTCGSATPPLRGDDRAEREAVDVVDLAGRRAAVPAR